MRRGRTWLARSRGRFPEHKNLFDVDGTVEEDEKRRLYVDTLPCASRGDRCGVLYKDMHKTPSENISAETLRLVSRTKSGEV